jgi:hypothetical protein
VTGVNSPFNVSLLTKQDRQCTYKRKIEARSYNHFCRGIAIIITFSESVCIALVVEHALLMRPVVCGLSGSTDLILSTTFVWNISHSKNNSARYCHKGGARGGAVVEALRYKPVAGSIPGGAVWSFSLT